MWIGWEPIDYACLPLCQGQLKCIVDCGETYKTSEGSSYCMVKVLALDFPG